MKLGFLRPLLVLHSWRTDLLQLMRGFKNILSLVVSGHFKALIECLINRGILEITEK